MINRPIVIVGFMGSGKTSVAAGVANELNCEAIDLDSFIIEELQRTPKEIIEEDGEDKFREIETKMLGRVLANETMEGLVIAAGGGAWTIAENRKTIRQHGALVVWLDAAFDLCWKRIESTGQTRPLARSRRMAENLYLERRAVYELADAHVFVEETKSVAEIAKEVADAVLLQNENS
jgi:shikimate kinase